MAEPSDGATAPSSPNPACGPKVAAVLCDAAARSDLGLLRETIDSGADVNSGDYDSRTALHLAASEGLLPVVAFLCETLRADLGPRDRWGHAPLDDAIAHAHGDVAEYLRGRARLVQQTRPAAAAAAVAPAAGEVGAPESGAAHLANKKKKKQQQQAAGWSQSGSQSGIQSGSQSTSMPEQTVMKGGGKCSGVGFGSGARRDVPERATVGVDARAIARERSHVGRITRRVGLSKEQRARAREKKAKAKAKAKQREEKEAGFSVRFLPKIDSRGKPEISWSSVTPVAPAAPKVHGGLPASLDSRTLVVPAPAFESDGDRKPRPQPPPPPLLPRTISPRVARQTALSPVL